MVVIRQQIMDFKGKTGYRIEGFNNAQFGQEFSLRLKKRREWAGMTQVEVSRAIGTSPALYSRWEDGNRVPTMRFIFGLAALFECKPLDLLPELEVK